MQSTQIMAMYGTDGFDMVQRLLEQMDAVSHLPQDKHASIAIKPNLVVAHTGYRCHHPSRDHRRHHLLSASAGL